MDTSDFFFKLTGVLAIFTIFAAAVSCEQTAADENGIVAFVNVNVIPMTNEQVLEDQTVIVENGRIISVSSAGQADLPAGAIHVDGTGRYLMPGLAEMHGHVPGPDNPEYLRNVLFLYISNGVTTVRNMAGNPYHPELRDEILRGEIPGPALYIASPWLSTGNMPTPDDAGRVVQNYHEAGFDLLKIGSIPPETYDRMAASAHETGIPFAGHIPEGVGLERAIEAGQASIDHLDRYVEFLVPDDVNTEDRNSGFFGSGLVDLVDTNRIQLAAEKTAEAGTWNVPTLSLVEHLASPEPPEEMIRRPEMRYMPQDVLDSWLESARNFRSRDDFQPEAAQRLVEIRRMLLKALYDGGAPVALGSDAPQFFNVPGFSIHHEMRMMVDAGLTPYEVLVTGTRNPAEYFGIPQEFGTIEPGRRADLILLEDNPFEDIANVQKRAGVMVRGEWMPESYIRERLEEIAEAVESR
ncbi:MAG: amidohydrolase family protein [Balneolaceae bacterium]